MAAATLELLKNRATTHTRAYFAGGGSASWT